MDTVTNVKVRIRLVHPTAGIRFYDFITDTEFTNTSSDGQFSFNGVLYKPGIGCSGLLSPIPTPNPASAALSFTIGQRSLTQAGG